MAVKCEKATPTTGLTGVSPIRQLHVLSGNTPPLMFPDDPVAISDFIYCPRCSRHEQLVPPHNYYMFILTKPNFPINIVMIRNTLIKKIEPNFFFTHPTTKAHQIMETWDISNRLNMFYQEAKFDYPGRDKLLQDLADIITTLLLQGIPKPVPVQPKKRLCKDISLAVEYIHTNYNIQMTLDDIARQVNYSQYHFIRIFKKETGLSPFEYLTKYRLDKARELLSDSPLSITEICLQCGFQNSSHFATVFKRNTGLSPSAYRQNS